MVPVLLHSREREGERERGVKINSNMAVRVLVLARHWSGLLYTCPIWDTYPMSASVLIRKEAITHNLVPVLPTYSALQLLMTQLLML